MTTNLQIERRLKGAPHFIGVYSADNLPDPKQLPQDSSLIVNYSDTSDEGTHWVAMIHLATKHRPPEYFDSFGFPPSGDNGILKTDAPFEEYMEKVSKLYGHRGKYYYNKNNMQCVTGDVCGEYCVKVVLTQELPEDLTTGKIRPQWSKILNLKGGCRQADATVRKMVRLRT